MSSYIQYQLDDDTFILVESEVISNGPGKVSRDATGQIIAKAGQKFEDAFTAVKKSAVILRRQFEDLKADEVEVTFGLIATGEAGNFAIGKVGAQASYTVRLKWVNQSPDEIPNQPKTK